MAVNVDEMKKNYEENLKPGPYHQTIVVTMEKLRPEFAGILRCLYDAMESEKYRGQRLLDIGSGATVHMIASASTYFKDITLSDFVDANCEELKNWLWGESALDWTETLKGVAEIEGCSDLEKGAQDIASRIRDSVKKVVHCDVLSDQVIPLEAGKDFDVIVTSLTLEAAATDFPCFVQVLKRLHGLLRPGGALMMVGFLNGGNKWEVGIHDFPYMTIGKEGIDQALDLAQFGNREWTVVPKESKGIEYQYDGMYFVASKAR